MSSIIKYKCCIRTTRMLCHAMPNEGSMVSGNNNTFLLLYTVQCTLYSVQL